MESTDLESAVEPAAPRPQHARRHAAPRSARQGGTAVRTAVLLATAAAGDGAPAAALAWEQTTLLGRLLDQLADLGVQRAHVITRPAGETALEPHARDRRISVEWRTWANLAGDLRAVEEIARSGGGGLV